MSAAPTTGGWFPVHRDDLAKIARNASPPSRSLAASAVYVTLLDIGNASRSASIRCSISGIAVAAGVSYRTAAARLHDLSRLGLITIQLTTDHGARPEGISTYTLARTVSPSAADAYPPAADAYPVGSSCLPREQPLPTPSAADADINTEEVKNNKEDKQPILLSAGTDDSARGDTDNILQWWNDIAKKHRLAKLQTLTTSRRKNYMLRKKEGLTPEVIEAAIGQAGTFLRSSGWFGFDWLVKNDTNWRKLVEGNYRDMPGTRQQRPSGKIVASDSDASEYDRSTVHIGQQPALPELRVTQHDPATMRDDGDNF